MFIQFISVGHPSPEAYNPADHYVKALAIIPGKEDECRQEVNRICDVYDGTPEGNYLKLKRKR